MKVYFVVKHVDVTPEIVEKSLQTSIFSARKSKPTLMGSYRFILKFCPTNIPNELYNLDYQPMTKQQVQDLIASEPDKWYENIGVNYSP